MSDDEDFYDDEYDEDWVWFEDASPDIAVSTYCAHLRSDLFLQGGAPWSLKSHPH